ncbi:hypothetical protein WA1_18640 [Scytonema hofmannii PCC 7110]|uniref:Uncharacterized protein n=1 Tax=Scytonema hofmannii PCC 7110 TaxID=128403 RepID=A0A139XBJ8_9CYAN|nr:hypothetical protein [Scytonema hofmannii]KYC42023.1 hypothetical protein WA1_18640 [Scytonema hofmannii PCC 7110]
MNKILLTTSVGVIALFVEGIDPKIKVAAALITGTAGLITTLKGAHKYMNARDEITEERELAIEEQERLAREAQKIGIDRKQVDLDLADLEKIRQDVNAEIEKVKREAEEERSRLQKIVKAEIEARRNELEADYSKRLKEVDQLEIDARATIATLTAEWEAEKTIGYAEFQQQVKIWKAEKQQQETAIASERELLKSEIDSLKRSWENQKVYEEQELRSHIELEQQKVQAWKQGEEEGFNEAMQIQFNELQAKWNEDNKQVIKKNVEHNVNNKLKPLRDAIARLEHEKNELTARLMYADEELKRLKIPPRMRGIQPHELIGRRFQEFYRGHGIDVEIKLCMIEANSDVKLRFTIWHQTPIKNVKKLFPELMVDFHLAETPEPVLTHDGYEIILRPITTPFMGQIPRSGVDRASINRMVAEGRLEAPSLEEIDRSFQEEAGTRRLMEEMRHKEEMLGFVEPQEPLPRPVPNTPITTLEVKYVEFLLRWRYEASRGRLPNLSNQDDILSKVYGVRPGRGTETEVEGLSLRDRLKTIFDMLGHVYRTRGN